MPQRRKTEQIQWLEGSVPGWATTPPGHASVVVAAQVSVEPAAVVDAVAVAVDVAPVAVAVQVAVERAAVVDAVAVAVAVATVAVAVQVAIERAGIVEAVGIAVAAAA